MKKAVVLLSGGMDSTTALYKAIAEGRQVFPLFVQYGQKSGYDEYLAAMRVCAAKGLELRVVQVQGLYSREHSGACIYGNTKFDPKQELEKDYIPPTYTPFRNPILVSLAVAYAEQLRAEEIWIGSHWQDCFYPDDTPDAMKGMQTMIYSSARDKIKLRAPFLRMGKEGIVKIGRELGVPYKETWSCYESGTPCGTCESCVKRMEVLDE